jgi:cytochrome c biogenesis protein CcmG, thiol:disulfide interchange protein DsbE
MRRWLFWVPLALFLLFVALVAVRMAGGKDDTIRSQMVGKALPDFTLPAMLDGRDTVSRASLVSGQPVVLNIFASWCVPCAAEAPQLMALKQRGIPVDAIAIRDKPEDVVTFLARWGDPFRNIGSDRASQVQFALGSSGVPETFIVDGQGFIRHQHVGIIGEQDLPELIAAYEAAR